jgi:hypothetical protein
MELNFASTFIPSSLDEVLAPATLFALQLTQIINRTAPWNGDDLPTYSAIWSSSFTVEADELFSEETRYTFFQRTYTNVTITIDESLFYVSNLEEPIARQSEIIFHNLLFTIVVLELFGLLFLMIKLLLIPAFNTIFKRFKYISKKNQVVACKNNLDQVVVDKINPPSIYKPGVPMKPHRRWSTIIGTPIRRQDNGDNVWK